MGRIYQYTRRYRRGPETSAIEVDNKVVFLRDAAGTERSHGFHDFAVLDAFVDRCEAELRAAGFASIEGASGPDQEPYDIARALADLRAVAGTCDLDARDIAAGLARVPRGVHPLLVARAVARGIPGFSRALSERRTDLWSIWFAADDRALDEPVPEAFDPLLAPPVSDGIVFGAADLDRWIVTPDDTVWRVHPEEARDVGTVAEFMTEQVRRALADP